MQFTIERHSLSGFLEDSEQYISRLRETGKPEVLTHGGGNLVVQDARAYCLLLEEIDLLQSAIVLRDRVEAIERGEEGTPVDEAFQRIHARLSDHLGLK